MKSLILASLSVFCLTTGAHGRPPDNGTEVVSLGLGGASGDGNSESPALSADGRFVAFESDATNLVAGDTNDRRDVFLHDRQTGTTVRVSESSEGAQGNGHSRYASISDDGRYIAFRSSALNLVGADTNASTDIFLHDGDS